MNKNKLSLVLSAVGIFAVVGAFSAVAFAQTMPPQGPGGFEQHNNSQGSESRLPAQFPGVFGTVTAISGTTISVQSQRASSTIYAVAASNATVMKNGTSSTVSAIAVGDMIMVQGTVSGTSVTATKIFDGKFAGGTGFPGRPFNGSSTFSRASGTAPFGPGGSFHRPSGTPPFASGTVPGAPNLPPSISGTVSAVDGSTLTVTGNNGTTYTVDVTNAALIKQGNSTSSISAINVGDSVQIQGTASGTLVTATVVLDNVSKTSSSSGSGSGFGGLFGTIGSLLANLFHFKF